MGFNAQINANISNFERNLSKAQSDIDKFASKVSDRLNKVGDSFKKTGTQLTKFVSVPLAGAITGMGLLAKSTADASKDLESMSVVTGLSVQKLQEYEHISTKATVPTDTLSGAVLNLQRRLRDTSDEAGGATEILRDMGVSLKNMDGTMKSSGQVTEDAIKAFAQLEDGVEKSSKGYQVFGGQWQNIVQIADLGVEALDNLSIEAHDLGLVLSDEAVSGSAKFGIEVDVLKKRLTALKKHIGAELAPMLNDTLLPIIENKIVPAFQKTSDRIKVLIDRFNNLSPKAKEIAIAITGITVAIGPTLVAMGALVRILPFIVSGFTAMTGPIGIAIVAITTGAIAIIRNWDNVVDYFTTGQGGDTFKAITRDVIKFKDDIVTVFTEIKRTVKSIWSSMGSDLEDESETFLQTINRGFLNTLNLWRNLWIDFKKARASDNLKEEFENIGTMFSNFGKGLVADVVEPVDKVNEAFDTMASGMDMPPLIRELGEDTKETTPEVDALNKEIDALKKKIESLKKSLNNTSTESIIPQGSLKELSEKLKILYEQLDNETTQSGRIKVANLINELENKVVRIKVGIEMANTNIEGISTGQIDAPTFDLDSAIDKMNADLDRMNNAIKSKEEILAQNIQTMNNLLVGGFVGIFTDLGNAIGSGENVLGALGKSIIGALGDMAIQVGSLMIGFGTAAEALWSLIASPMGAIAGIAAGAALIALGAAAKSAVSGAIQGGMGGGGYSGGGGYQSTRVDAPMQQGEFDVRGSYRDEQVQFVISGDNLVGVLDKKTAKRNRIG